MSTSSGHASDIPHVQELRVEKTDPTLPQAVALIAQLDEYHRTLYPDESVHRITPEALKQTGAVFLGAWLNDRLVGCGAYLNHGGEYGELKRMFVKPEARGLAVGRRILEALEAEARAIGLSIMRLETGVSQPEAARLYERAGYVRREGFGLYPHDPASVFMEKRFDAFH